MARYRIGRIIVEIGGFSQSGQFGYPCGSSFISDRNKCYRDPKTGSRLKKPITRSIYDKIMKSKSKAAQSLYRDRENAIRSKRSEGAKGWKKPKPENKLQIINKPKIKTVFPVKVYSDIEIKSYKARGC